MKNVRTCLVTTLVLAAVAAVSSSSLLRFPAAAVAQEQSAPQSVLQSLIQMKENELVQLATQREQRRETIRVLETLKTEAEKNLATARLAKEAALRDRGISSVEFDEYIATTRSAGNALGAVTNRLAETIKDLEGILAAEQEEERALSRLRIRQEAERIQQALGQ